jgi:hypothetical protein
VGGPDPPELPAGVLGGLDAYREFLGGEPEDLEPQEPEQLSLWTEDDEDVASRRAA